MNNCAARGKLWIMLMLAVAAMLLCACGKGEVSEVAAAKPNTEATPVVIRLDMVEAPATPTLPPATLTPTPEPTPTPLPFSHYAPTINMTYEELVGGTSDVKSDARTLLKDGYPDPNTYYIIVDLQWQVTMIYKRLDDGTKFGKPDLDNPVRYMICSTGNPDREYGHETTTGIFQIERSKSNFYQFVNLEAAQYLTRIRSRTYFHSVLYEKKGNLNTLMKDSYDNLGKKASHACIRLTVPDARWIFYNIGYGTTCEIRMGDPLDTETQLIRAQLVLPPSKENVKLNIKDIPWTDNWTIDDVAHELKYVSEALPLPDLGEGDDDLATPTPDPAAGGGTPPTIDDGGGSTGGDSGGTGGDDGRSDGGIYS